MLFPLAANPVPSLLFWFFFFFCLLLSTAVFQICILYWDYLSDYSLSSNQVAMASAESRANRNKGKQNHCLRNLEFETLFG